MLRGGAIGVGGALASACDGGGGRPGEQTLVPRSYDFNQGWLFGGPYVTGSDGPGFDDSRFEQVTLPHTVVPLSWTGWTYGAWEKVWIYRKHFKGSEVAGGRVLAVFDGVMTNATAVLNGTTMSGHVGGYLPWTVELTRALRTGDNVLAIVVDSRWLDVPPAAPPHGPESIDYLQPGGIYRDVSLAVLPGVFISDVFAKPEYVLDPSRRRVAVRVTIDAAAIPAIPGGNGTVTVAVSDGESTMASVSAPAGIRAGQVTTTTITLTGLAGVAYWSPESPKLYTLTATLRYGDGGVRAGSGLTGSGGSHTVTRNIGFREAVFRVDGFYLNGARYKIFGINRHQMFPYTGMAAPARLQRHDAEILRNELNCTMVRCSHYPQSPHFLDACDEVGLMVFEETPGWHWVGDATFQEIVLQNIRDMILRDRSRPSVILWGTRPNEAANYPGLYARARSVADDLDGSRQTTGTMTTQSTAGWAEDVFSYDNYAVEDGLPLLLPAVPGVPYLVSEAVGALDPTYRWTDSQDVLARQALAHAIVHDEAQARSRYSGALCWAGIDYWSASPNIKNWNSMRTPGVIDVFRVPKPGAAVYQTQVSPKLRPLIVPTFSWPEGAAPDGTASGRMIATNCDRLEIYLGGRHYATVRPDRARFPGLSYPPAFADLTLTAAAARQPPELRISGYVGNNLVTTRTMSAETAIDRLLLIADDDEIIADGSDATRITFRATDAYGNHRTGVTGDVTLDISGPGVIVGENPFGFGEFGGVGGVFVRSKSGQTGTIRVTATHPRLGTAGVSVGVRTAVLAIYL